MTRYMAHPIPKRNVHIPAAANAPHISLHNLIRKAGGGGGLISCWCWNVEMLPGATGVTIIRGRPHWAAQAAGTGGLVLLRAHIGAGEGWWGGAIVGRGASCGKCLVDIPRCWGHCLLDITRLGRAGAWPPPTSQGTHQYWNFDGGF